MARPNGMTCWLTCSAIRATCCCSLASRWGVIGGVLALLMAGCCQRTALQSLVRSLSLSSIAVAVSFSNRDRTAPSRYSPANARSIEELVFGGMATGSKSGSRSVVAPETTFKLETVVVNGVEYATVDQVRKMAYKRPSRALQGEAMTLRRPQMSPAHDGGLASNGAELRVPLNRQERDPLPVPEIHRQRRGLSGQYGSLPRSGFTCCLHAGRNLDAALCSRPQDRAGLASEALRDQWTGIARVMPLTDEGDINSQLYSHTGGLRLGLEHSSVELA